MSRVSRLPLGLYCPILYLRINALKFIFFQFGGQEPKPESEIKEFVQKYNVQFDMFSKIDVNGSGTHPLFEYLKNKQGGFLMK